MSPVQTAVAVLIAFGIPSVFLLIIYTLDLYASRTFGLVVLCFAWGGIGGLGLSYVFNTYAAIPLIQQLSLDYVFLYVAFAPVAEEILKSLSLFYVSRRPEFTYFVDGAIYGFAAGIGFSITENFLYIGYHPDRGIPLTLVRAFSVCLMHGTAAGLVGAAIGRFRFRKGAGRGMAVVGGWVAAILLHALFNSVSQADIVRPALKVPLQVGIGLAGVGLIAFFISLGLREERQWFAETLDRKLGVTGAEVRAAQAYATIDEVLRPIAEQFPDQTEQVESLLLQQAQMGIKRKVQQEVNDPKLREKLGEEIACLRAEMEQLRHEIGPYIMVYVRSVFPEGLLDLWSKLELLAVRSEPVDARRWADMLYAEATTEPTRDIFGRLRQEEESRGSGDGQLS
jgi:RsiW-degrading membrane proteinase PrsW (M82 family)